MSKDRGFAKRNSNIFLTREIEIVFLKDKRIQDEKMLVGSYVPSLDSHHLPVTR